MNSFIYAVRTLRKNPGFSLTVIAILALGFAGNVAIFSVVNAVLLRPLPYDHSEDLVQLIGNVQRAVVERRGGSLPDYRDWKGQSRSFEGLAPFWAQDFAMRDANERVAVDGEIVGADYFRLLRVNPILGREFAPNEETDTSSSPVAVISQELWAGRLGSDPAVIGKRVTLNSTSYTIIGVMPVGFRGLGDRAQVWVPPASLPPEERNFEDRSGRGLTVLGRLRPGITIDQAQTEMNTISRALERAYPDTNEKRGVEVTSLIEETFGNVRPALLVLLAAVGMVLLIACANVANLILLRTEARQAEITIRAALGASRAALIRVNLAETILLSLAGLSVGLLVSGWVVNMALTISPIQLPSFVNVTFDWNVLIFGLGLAFLIALVMAITPAMQFTPAHLHEALTAHSARTTASRRAKRLRKGLVVSEVALTFILLITAGLLTESFRQLLKIDTGFQIANLLTLRIGFDSGGPNKAVAVKEALAALPGIRSVALSSVVPFRSGGAVFYTAEGQAPDRNATTTPRAYIQFVTSDFFRTMAIPLRYGREFTSTEPESSVIVSEKLVDRFWRGQNPIGKRIRIGRDNPGNPWLNIVGIAANTRTHGIPDNPTPDPDIYFPFQMFGGGPAVLIRTDTEASLLGPAVIREIRRVDKLALVSNIATAEDLMRRGTARARFLSALSTIFSGMALVLALVGIYGSMSYTVARATREIGIRIALGANRHHLMRMVLGRTLALIAAGLAMGLIGSAFAGRSISTMLFGIRPEAPSIFVAVSLLLMVTGLGAAYLPARRAARIDPLEALRQE